eukprot:GHRR01000246.1.p1 GENE.GHRR01000246.1~~GHRR01000246.1.p1  ORF type:complete len:161 (+),score=49.28 GHRR01000246.1:226-708(+)
MLARSARALLPLQSQLSTSCAAFYATGRDPSVADRVRDSPTADNIRRTAEDVAGTNPEQPSVTEKIRETVGKVTEKVGEMFKEDGKIGHQFTPEGKAGGTAQQVGGPFDKKGSVGHQFTSDGAIGGRVEKAAERVDEAGEQMQEKAQQNQGKEQLKNKGY